MYFKKTSHIEPAIEIKGGGALDKWRHYSTQK